MRNEYRVWCVDRNEWEKDECLLRSDGVLLHPNRGMYMPLKTTGHIIEFCTGLKDKNGKKIYEGDIMNFKADARDPSNSGWYIAGSYGFHPENAKIVEWDNSGWVLNNFPLYQELEMYEVIGNIHENKELLDAKT